jgi:hypothetical protein
MCFNQANSRSSTNSKGCQEKIKTQPLDDLDINPDWIKIDTEGSELRILRGGAQTIMTSKPIMLVEAHLSYDRHMDTKIISFLRQLNPHYQFNITIDWWGAIAGVKRIYAFYPR